MKSFREILLEKNKTMPNPASVKSSAKLKKGLEAIISDELPKASIGGPQNTSQLFVKRMKVKNTKNFESPQIPNAKSKRQTKQNFNPSGKKRRSPEEISMESLSKRDQGKKLLHKITQLCGAKKKHSTQILSNSKLSNENSDQERRYRATNGQERIMDLPLLIYSYKRRSGSAWLIRSYKTKGWF